MPKLPLRGKEGSLAAAALGGWESQSRVLLPARCSILLLSEQVLSCLSSDSPFSSRPSNDCARNIRSVTTPPVPLPRGRTSRCPGAHRPHQSYPAWAPPAGTLRLQKEVEAAVLGRGTWTQFIPVSCLGRWVEYRMQESSPPKRVQPQQEDPRGATEPPNPSHPQFRAKSNGALQRLGLLC